jgi:hypothetical protein
MKNTVTPEAQALIDEINSILSELQNDPDIEYSADDLKARISELLATQVAEMENKLKTTFQMKNSVDNVKYRKMFADAMRNAAGRGKGAFAEEFNKICVKNGITGMPSIVEVFPEIQTKFENTSILSKLRKLGQYSLQIPVSVQEDSDVDVRAKGHAVLTNAKNDENLVITPKTLTLGAIYKKISVPKLLSYQVQDDTALFQWLVEELISRVDNEIQRAILVGDGRASDSADKINSFETIGTKTAADAYTVYKNKVAAYPTLADVRYLIDDMRTDSPISIYANPKMITNLKTYVAASGGSVTYMTDEVLADQLGVAEIIRTRMLTTAMPTDTSKNPVLIAMQHDNYGYVGNDLFTVDYEKWDYNADVFLAEIFAGGGIIKPMSTGLITISKS